MHDNWAMTSMNEEKRRSSRMFRRMSVQVHGLNPEGHKFRESCQTIVVNAQGGLIYLNETVELGGQLQIVNPVTDEEQECRVVYLGDLSDKGQRVGLEFLSPAPHFWGLEFSGPDTSRQATSRKSSAD
jgi:hypothetical protein